MHHQTAHTDHPRHISVDSDPHSHARATCRTPRRAWLTDLIRVIWTCLRVLAVAWTCGYLGPSAWTMWGRYMTVERRYCNGQVVVVWWSVWSCCGVDGHLWRSYARIRCCMGPIWHLVGPWECTRRWLDSWCSSGLSTDMLVVLTPAPRVSGIWTIITTHSTVSEGIVAFKDTSSHPIHGGK